MKMITYSNTLEKPLLIVTTQLILNLSTIKLSSNIMKLEKKIQTMPHLTPTYRPLEQMIKANPSHQ